MSITTATAKQVGNERLAPLRAWAAANHGAITRITSWLQERTGEAVTRQTVGRWLASETGKRQIPHHGWGILLEEAYRELAAE